MFSDHKRIKLEINDRFESNTEIIKYFALNENENEICGRH